jgi:pimeloyl-ACP methyl ester carboxylesterase
MFCREAVDMQARARTIRVEGAELYVQELGNGPPLLLLHGLTGTGSDWRHVFDLQQLAQDHRVLLPDARGHGRSTDPSHNFSFAQCARDAIAILDDCGIESTRAIGLSLGAKTLLHVAADAPERVRAMVVVSTTPRLPDATREAFRAAAAAAHTPEEWAAMRALHAHGDDQIAALWRLPQSFADDPADMTSSPERLRRIEARTLVVAGDRDPLYPVELAVELFRCIAGSSLWVVPGGGHVPVFSSWREAFVRTAMAFLAE